MTAKPQGFFKLPLLRVLAGAPGGVTREAANRELATVLSHDLGPDDWATDTNIRAGEPLWHNRVSSLVRGWREPRSGIMLPTATSGPNWWQLAAKGWEEARRIAPSPPTTYVTPPPPAPTKGPVPFSIDPDVVDRGLRAHHDTIEALAREVQAAGIEPFRDQPGHPPYDLAWFSGPTLNVAEVKSITPSNRESQLRLGLGQVLRYRNTLASGRYVVQAWLVPEKECDSSWVDTCSDVHVRMWWPGLPIT